MCLIAVYVTDSAACLIGIDNSQDIPHLYLQQSQECHIWMYWNTTFWHPDTYPAEEREPSGTSEVTVMLVVVVVRVLIIVMVAAPPNLAPVLVQQSTEHFTCAILMNPDSPCGIVLLWASPSYRRGYRGTERFYPKIPVHRVFRHSSRHCCKGCCSVQLLSHVWLLVTLWTAAGQASL